MEPVGSMNTTPSRALQSNLLCSAELQSWISCPNPTGVSGNGTCTASAGAVGGSAKRLCEFMRRLCQAVFYRRHYCGGPTKIVMLKHQQRYPGVGGGLEKEAASFPLTQLCHRLQSMFGQRHEATRGARHASPLDRP